MRGNVFSKHAFGVSDCLLTRYYLDFVLLQQVKSTDNQVKLRVSSDALPEKYEPCTEAETIRV